MHTKRDTVGNSCASDFEQMYVNNFHKIRSFCNHYLGDDNLSKNVAQDVFVSVWNNRDKLSFSDGLLPYLFVLAKNMCLNILKREKVKQNYSDYGKSQNRDALNLESLKDSSIGLLYGNELEKLLNKALQIMPDNVRSTFCLSRFRNLKYEEIAQNQEISVKTVEYRIMYALRILRKILKDYLPVLLGYLIMRLF